MSGKSKIRKEIRKSGKAHPTLSTMCFFNHEYKGSAILGRQICANQLSDKSVLDREGAAEITDIDKLLPGQEVCLKWPFPLNDYPEDTVYFKAQVAHVEQTTTADPAEFYPECEMVPAIHLDEGLMEYVEKEGGTLTTQLAQKYLDSLIDQYQDLVESQN